MAELKTAGRYELQEELGRGAMGIVYKAHDPRIGRTVAVKTMRLTEAVTGMSHDELIKRFQTETRAAGLLTHPNIVVVYDAGEDAGVFYITMEYIQGRSLQALMDQKQVFPLPRVLRIMEQAGAALDFAHKNNVVHRDIKPANLMLTGDDIVKVTDFGTAKILAKGASQTGAILGTPSYMSPEQVKGKPVDGRSDIFSLGVILYELVTSEKPFPGQNVTTVIYKIVNEDPIPPREFDSSVHPGLSHVITRALSKDPDERYQNCKQLVEELKSYRELGGPVESATVVMPGRARPKAVEDAIRAMSGGSPGATGMGQIPTVQPTMAVPSPGQPPRATAPRTQALPPLTGAIPREAAEEPKKGHAALWISLVLVVMIGAGGYFLWPTLQEMFTKGRQQIATQKQSPGETPQPGAAGGEAQPASGTPSAAKAPAVEPAATDTASEKVKSDFTNHLFRNRIRDKIRVQVAGNRVILSGTLTSEEHRRLMLKMPALPRKMKLDDRIQIAKAAPGTETEKPEKPRTSPGKGEIEVLTLSGAKALLVGPKGEQKDCTAPCRFEDLAPGRYTMDVTKEGYRPEKRIITLAANNVWSNEIVLQAIVSDVMISSRPTGADVYVNGEHHPEKTPTTIQLQPGSYDISVRKPGYEPYAQKITVQGEEFRKIDVGLPPSSGAAAPAPASQPPAAQAPAAQPRPQAAAMGFVDIKTVPPSADILVDNRSMNRRAPSRLQLPPGKYRITLFLPGYQPSNVDVQVEDGKTVNVREALRPR